MNNVTCQVSVYSKIDNFWVFFQNEINAGDLATFCHCWRLAGDNFEMLESLMQCGRHGNYAIVHKFEVITWEICYISAAVLKNNLELCEF